MFDVVGGQGGEEPKPMMMMMMIDDDDDDDDGDDDSPRTMSMINRVVVKIETGGGHRQLDVMSLRMRE